MKQLKVLPHLPLCLYLPSRVAGCLLTEAPRNKASPPSIIGSSYRIMPCSEGCLDKALRAAPQCPQVQSILLPEVVPGSSATGPLSETRVRAAVSACAGARGADLREYMHGKHKAEFPVPLIFKIQRKMDTDINIRTLFTSAKTQRKELESFSDPTSSIYQENLQAAIKSLEGCRKIADRISLFSPNETEDDISSGDLQ